jgi:uncharacterized protein YcbK (DUF882 family)
MNNLDTWLGFAKFLLGTVVLGLVTTFVNKDIQNKEIALKEIDQRRAIELREQEQLGKFIEHALAEDVGLRRRFSQYFSTVTRSQELRNGWIEYNKAVEQEFLETQKARDELVRKIESEKLGSSELSNARRQLAELERMLSATSVRTKQSVSVPDIQLTPNFQLSELISSRAAMRLNIDNTPNGEEVVNLFALASNVLEPIRAHFNSDVKVISGYRSEPLNRALGGARHSQHSSGYAADIEVPGYSNQEVACWIKSNLDFDLLQLSYRDSGQPYSGYVGVSYISNSNRKKSMTMGSTLKDDIDCDSLTIE